MCILMLTFRHKDIAKNGGLFYTVLAPLLTFFLRPMSRFITFLSRLKHELSAMENCRSYYADWKGRRRERTPTQQELAERVLAYLRVLHRLRVPWAAGNPPPPKRYGRYGERVAASWLRARGHRILRRDWRWGRRGELDIVSREGDTLVFTEVKSALVSSVGGAPARRVNREKRELIRIGARNWLRLLNKGAVPHRFDIIEVYLPPAARPEIIHTPNAFGMEEGREWNARHAV